jgi:putative transposase
MVRTARSAAGGVCYHVLNRGNDRKRVFLATADFDLFLDLAAAASRRHPVEVFAYCLMPNHFHLVVRPRERDSLARWIHWLLTTHTQAYRRSYETAGHLWQGRYKAFPIQEDQHLLTVIRYVERNALRAGLVSRAEDWQWGSLAERLGRGRAVAELLDDSPCALPRDWCDGVNAAESGATLSAVRACISAGSAFGSNVWVRRAEEITGARLSVRARGRPRKVPAASGDVGLTLDSPRLDRQEK